MSDETPILRLAGISRELIPDAGIAESRAVGTDDQMLRRTYVRAVFALIEGLNHARWHLAMRDPDVPAPMRDKARAAAIRARRSMKVLCDTAKVVASTITSITGLVAAYGPKNPLPDPSDGAWNDFIRAVEVRHRVTHPLTHQDCLVSADDFALVQRVHHWYQDVDMRLMAPLSD